MTSPRAPVIGLPTLRLSSWASSSLCSLISAANLARRPAALAGGPGRPALAVLERGLRGRDGPVHVLAPAQRRRGDDLPGRRARRRRTSRRRRRRRTGRRSPCAPSSGRRPGWAWLAAGSSLAGPREAASVVGEVVVAGDRSRSAGRPGAGDGEIVGRVLEDGPAVTPCSAATIAAPMIPASLRSVAAHDRRPDRQPRDEPVGVLADAAAEDHQVRPHQLLDRARGARRGRPPRPSTTGRAGPARSAADRRSAARPRISIWPNSVFGTRTPSLNTPDPTPVPSVRKMTTPGLVPARSRSASRRSPPRRRR